eukprot:GHVS01036874.1.p1 GENE.GHVS01036874.1~~GHVS01036874.1.p1  ORF type:complete len:278 (+),score=73.43 GHVS01036874.1:337-1170(+)
MAGMGAGYDLSVSTFSPDGRVFQVEYATKAVDASTTSLAFACSDGIVLAVYKQAQNPMVLHHKTNRRLYPVDKHIAVAVSGLIADGRQLVARARSECANYRQFFGEPIPVKLLSERIALYVHAYTLYWSVRPFGASLLIAAVDDEDEQVNRKNSTKGGGGLAGAVYCVEPSGTAYKYLGQAIGKGRQNVKTELEKLKLEQTTCKQGLVHAARILIHSSSEGTSSSRSSTAKDTVDVELGVISADTQWMYSSVGEEEATVVTDEAKRLLTEMAEQHNA